MNPDLTDFVGGYPRIRGRLGFKYDDGGRKAAGFKRPVGDCVCRSIAIVTGQPYEDVYHNLKEVARAHEPYLRGRGERSSPREGVRRTTYEPYLRSLGWEWHPTMFIGSGCTVHMRADELPKGILLLCVSRHMTAVIDGVEHSTYPSDRDGTRCVYGYWTPPKRKRC